MTKRKINILFSKFPILLLLLMAVAIGHGQTPTATLSGVVRNEREEVIKEAAVTAKNNATGKARHRSLPTRRDGIYSPFWSRAAMNYRSRRMALNC